MQPRKQISLSGELTQSTKFQLQSTEQVCIGTALSDWDTTNQLQDAWDGKEGGVKKVEGYYGQGSRQRS